MEMCGLSGIITRLKGLCVGGSGQQTDNVKGAGTLPNAGERLLAWCAY